MASTTQHFDLREEMREPQAGNSSETPRLQDIVPVIHSSSLSSALHRLDSNLEDDDHHFEPIHSKAASAPAGSTGAPTATARGEGVTSRTTSSTPSTKRELTNDDLRHVLSRRYTSRSSRGGEEEGEDDGSGEWAEVQKLMSRMFGRERQENSFEEKTRHVGVIWKNLTVKGTGLGAALQPTNGDTLLAIPRFVKGLLTRGRKGAGGGKPPIRTILNDFTVSAILENVI
jgi:hypothetical protein